jgi:CMP/dCMP kinase
VADPRPRREQEEEARVLGCPHLAALVRVEAGQEPGAAGDRSAAGVLDLDRPRDHQKPRPLVDLVLLKPFAGGQLDHDRASLRFGVEHLGVVRLDVEVRDLPALHRPNSIFSARMVIAIDGPAGAGKSTVARTLADRLGFTYLDSGAMYRCVALAALRGAVELDDGDAVGELAEQLEIGFRGDDVLLDGENVTEAIRAPDVSAAASRVSVHARVRAAMVARQRSLIDSGRYVAEGRDIGTVVSPEAPLKVFLTAQGEERARRRAAETGEPLDSVLESMFERDARDREREHGALRLADDAIEIDTTTLSVEGIVDELVREARERGLA